MNNYFPLHVHSEHSLKDGIGKIKQFPSRLQELGLSGSAITDHGSLSASVSFYEELTDNDLKPILGIEQYVCRQDCAIKTTENRKLDHLLILCKNTAGWKDLLNLTYDSNLPEHFYHNPRLDIDKLGDYTSGQNLISFAGHIGSVIAKEIVQNEQIQPNWKNDGVKLANKLQDIFGKGNFYLEVQLVNKDSYPIVTKLADCVREISKITKIPCIASTDSHYLRKEDAVLQRIIVCENLHIKMKDGPTSGMSGFFHSDNFHIPDYNEMRAFGNTEQELEQTLELASKCGDYDILKKPTIPKFQCPDNHDSKSWLRQLCYEGWLEKIDGKIPKDKIQEYADRTKYELAVLQEANLSDYFLIVKDIVDFGRTISLMGPGRGSVGGSLVAYLLGITKINPIAYGLIFERFYNSSRQDSLPDVDIDCPRNARQKIIQYITDKFSQDKICQVSTFASLKGKNVIKAVLRAYEDVSFQEMNEITKLMPEEAKIGAELHQQEEREDVSESSIIRYKLENDTKNELKEWVYLDKEGNLQGRLSKRFAQAIELENTKINKSTHAAGIVISQDQIRDSVPVTFDAKNKKIISALEMNCLEKSGKIKFDLLGLAVLDKIKNVADILRTGDVIEV